MKSSAKDLPAGKNPNPLKASLGINSSVKVLQAGKKPSLNKTPTVIKSSDKDSSSIKPNKNTTTTAVKPSVRVLQNQNLTKTCKEIKSSNNQLMSGNNQTKTSTTIKSSGKELLINKKSNQSKTVICLKKSSDEDPRENSLCSLEKQSINSSQVDALFDEEPSMEFQGTNLNLSPSKIFGDDSDNSSNRSKLSFRKISMEVASSLPLENDSDESEEEELVKKQPEAGTCFSQESGPVISLTVTSMSREQIEEHISCCLQLNTENKINTKNAFALKLIDCMTVMMKTAKDESNFAAVACQLDAGAKIYSNRVDAVHQQVMKLAESCLFAEKKDNKKNNKGSDEEDNEEVNGEKCEKIKIRKAKKKVLANPEQITRKLKGKNPRDNYVQLEARPGGILEKARRNPKDLSLTLEKYVPFWHEGPGTSVGGFVKIPKIELKSRQITPGLDLEILSKYLCRQDPPSPHLSSSTKYEIEQSSSPAEYESPQPASPAPSYFDNYNDESGEDFKLAEQTSQRLANEATSNEVHIVSVAESRMAKEMASKPSRLDVIRAVFHTEGENDYNYLKMDCKEYWAGPSYWKRPQGVNAAAYKKRTIRKKKEPIEIMYSKDSDKKSTRSKQSWSIVSSKRTTQLSKRTIANWNRKKVTYPPDIQFEPQTMFQLFNIDMKVFLSDEEPKDKDSTRDEECDMLSGDFQEEDENLENNHASGKGNLPFSEITINQKTSDTLHAAHINTVEDNADENAAELNSELIEEEVAAASTASSDDVYEGDNLVPMVKMVQVEPIRCVAKPNRVDFQNLKQVMLSVIQENIEDKENQDSEKVSKGTSGIVAFKDVLHELFNSNRLHHRTREDLSVSMAFLCLLTLTNEHSFSLNQAENSTEDILISYEMNGNN